MCVVCNSNSNACEIFPAASETYFVYTCHVMAFAWFCLCITTNIADIVDIAAESCACSRNGSKVAHSQCHRH